jgi:hypothetical protein
MGASVDFGQTVRFPQGNVDSGREKKAIHLPRCPCAHVSGDNYPETVSNWAVVVSRALAGCWAAHCEMGSSERETASATQRYCLTCG